MAPSIIDGKDAPDAGAAAGGSTLSPAKNDESNRALNVHVVDQIPSAGAMRRRIPTTDAAAATVWAARQEVNDVITGRDAMGRMLVLVGPCSIHDPEAAIEYARKLRPLRDELAGELVVVMRAYFEKPRTSVGWKGYINDPDLDDSCRMGEGLAGARQLLVQLNGDEGVPTAAEFLSADTARYYADLVSWTAVGARTTEAPAMRELASALPCAVGFKNTTSGDVQPCVDAMKSAAASHTFLSGRVLTRSAGNPHTHVVMRGGKAGTNYDAESCAKATAVLANGGHPPERQHVLVDCSHGNSAKDYKRQPVVLADVARQVAAGSTHVMGVMIESNLVQGAQKLAPGKTDVACLVRGQSVTDGCVGLDATATMLRTLAAAVRERRAMASLPSAKRGRRSSSFEELHAVFLTEAEEKRAKRSPEPHRPGNMQV